MLKSTVESAHKLYYLNGLVECAKTVIKDNSLFIAFSSAEDTSFTGTIKCENYEVENCTLGIFNTTQFLKLIKILDHNIEIKLQKEKDIVNKILISDNVYDLEYCLADLSMIKPTPKIKEPIYDLEINLSEEDVKKFCDAKKALGKDMKSFIIEAKNKQIVFTLGENSSFSNKIKFAIDIADNAKIIPMNFSVNVFNEILIANSDYTSGSLKISKEGLINVSFLRENLASSYFLVKLDI